MARADDDSNLEGLFLWRHSLNKEQLASDTQVYGLFLRSNVMNFELEMESDDLDSSPRFPAGRGTAARHGITGCAREHKVVYEVRSDKNSKTGANGDQLL